jgi:hypothetical protein
MLSSSQAAIASPSTFNMTLPDAPLVGSETGHSQPLSDSSFSNVCGLNDSADHSLISSSSFAAAGTVDLCVENDEDDAPLQKRVAPPPSVPSFIDSSHRSSGGDGEPAQSESDENEDDDDPDRLWCICRRPYTSDCFMIACDKCNEWYHGDCVLITEYVATSFDNHLLENSFLHAPSLFSLSRRMFRGKFRDLFFRSDDESCASDIFSPPKLEDRNC